MARGGIVWLTGLPCAGKSTLARALATRLAGVRRYELLDGDDVRTFLSSDLGSSREDRDANVQRIAYVARLLAGHGVLAIVAEITPYAATREDLKRRSEAARHPFVEVYVNVPLETAIARDVRGLYRRAQAGEIPCFTGISDPYEPPTEPVVEVHTDRETPTQSEVKIMRVLSRLQLV